MEQVQVIEEEVVLTRPRSNATRRRSYGVPQGNLKVTSKSEFNLSKDVLLKNTNNNNFSYSMDASKVLEHATKKEFENGDVHDHNNNNNNGDEDENNGGEEKGEKLVGIRKVKEKKKRCASERVSKSSLTSEPKKEREARVLKMKQSIKELIETETVYIKDLYTMIDKIMRPMSEKRNYLTGEPLVTREQLASIWSNITVLPGFNEVLLKELTHAAEHDEFQAKIGQVFISMADYMKIYTQFCSNQPISNQTVLELRNDSQFDAFLMEKADITVLEESHNLDLNAFLIKPVQRICKYPLFLREIINSSKETDVGYILLEQAYEKINNVILSINESKKITENNAKLRDITQILYSSPTIMIPGRKVIRYEALKKIIANKSNFKGMLFLFNDALFVGKSSKRKQSKFKYVTHITISPHCSVITKEDDVNSASCFVVNGKITCFTDTNALRDGWVADIISVIKSCSLSAPPSPMMRKSSENL